MNGDPTLSDTPVHQFADRAWDAFLEQDPLWATVQGDDRWDDRLDDPSPAGRAAFMAMVDGWAREMDALDSGDLSVEDTVTLGLMRAVVQRFRGAHELRLWQMDALDQLNGPQTLVGELARFQRTDTPARLDKLLTRLAAYPAWMAAHRANIADGVAAGRTAPAEVVERCIDQTRRMVDTPAAGSPLMLANSELSEDARASLLRAVRQHVQPALAAWLVMLQDYAGHVRPGPGVCHLPDGEAVYRHHIRAYTNLPEDPRAVHAYGLARLDEIEAAEAPIAAELGHASVASLRQFLDQDPANHVTDPAELIAAAEAWILRAEAEAPKWFGESTHRALRGSRRRAAHGARRAGRVLLPAFGGWQSSGHVLLQHLRPAIPPLAPSRAHDVSRSGSRAPLPTHRGAPSHRFAGIPTSRRHVGLWRLRGGLGALR